MSVFDILVTYREAIANGLLVTLQLSITVWSAGIVLGSAVGIMGAKWERLVGIPSRAASFLLSGLPILAFLFWLHYPLQTVLGILVDPFYTAAAALSVLNVFAVADIVRIAIKDFPAQYVTAAKVYGLSASTTLTKIQFPLILRQILPGLLIIQVNMLQATLFASLISVDEIFRVAQRINSVIYKPVEIYSAVAVLFLAICLPLNAVALWLRYKFTRDLSER